MSWASASGHPPWTNWRTLSGEFNSAENLWRFISFTGKWRHTNLNLWKFISFTGNGSFMNDVTQNGLCWTPSSLCQPPISYALCNCVTKSLAKGVWRHRKREISRENKKIFTKKFLSEPNRPFSRSFLRFLGVFSVLILLPTLSQRHLWMFPKLHMRGIKRLSFWWYKGIGTGQ